MGLRVSMQGKKTLISELRLLSILRDNLQLCPFLVVGIWVDPLMTAHSCHGCTGFCVWLEALLKFSKTQRTELHPGYSHRETRKKKRNKKKPVIVELLSMLSDFPV